MSAELDIVSDPPVQTSDLKPELLIVSDKAHHSLPVTRIFEDEYDIISTYDVLDAVEALNSSRVVAVLAEAAMLTRGGTEMLYSIRSNPQTAALPVFLVASPSETEYVIAGLQMGANDCIMKPIDPELALARVRAHLEVRKTLDEREATINRLQQKQEDQKRLLRMVTHDMKHPVANIRLAETLLRNYVELNPNSIKVIDSVLHSLDSLEEYISTFSHAVSMNSQLELNPTCFPVGALLYEVALQYTASAIRKNILLDVCDSDAKMHTDQARLTQVIGNLVSNAIKYSPYDTTIRLGAQRFHDCVRIYIADQGPGIPENERHLLFQEFGRLTTRPSGGEGSTGLGLWIVKNLVDAMGGAAGVDSPPEGGATFWVQLPAVLPGAVIPHAGA